MSLIEEALRKQQEEAGKSNAAGPSGTPAAGKAQTPPPPAETPADVPAEPGPEEEGKARRWPFIAAIVLLVFVLAGAAVWLSLVAFKQLARSKEPSAVRAQTPQVSVPTPTDLVTDARTNLETAVSAPTAALTAQTVTAATAIAQVSHAQGVQDTTHAVSQIEPPVEETPDSGAPPAVKELIVWPRVYLSGILKRGSGAGSAYLNNKIVAENDSIDGVKLVSVKASGVELEYKGEKRHLKLYGTTE